MDRSPVSHYHDATTTMMTTRRAMLSLFPLSLATGCAWILYPERRYQQNPGPIEVVPLVVDCLLFIPGLVPGIIALAVDFGTRAIYVPRGQVRRVEPHEIATMDDAVPERLDLRLVDADDREIGHAATSVDPLADRQTLSLHLPSTGASRLLLLADGRRVASAHIHAPASSHPQRATPTSSA